jgi:hypothetical protein
MSRSAAVVDLQDFRRRRSAREAPAASAPRPVAPTLPYAALVPVPVWVVWMPVWTVA